MRAKKYFAGRIFRYASFEVITETPQLIASNTASLPPQGQGFSEKSQTIKHERFTNTFPKYLRDMENSNVVLEDAVKKITSKPAEVFKIKNRGLVKEGYFADLVLWKDGKVQATFVNGQMAYEEGKFMDSPAGQIIKR
ncbi:MAG: amidohydrolase family protein [Patescibacteria group bacterium]